MASVTLSAEATSEEIILILKTSLLNYETDLIGRKAEFDPLHFETLLRIIDELIMSFGLDLLRWR